MEKWLLFDVQHFCRDGDDNDDLCVCLLVEATWMLLTVFWTHDLRGCVAQCFLRHLIDLMIRKVVFLALYLQSI